MQLRAVLLLQDDGARVACARMLPRDQHAHQHGDCLHMVTQISTQVFPAVCAQASAPRKELRSHCKAAEARLGIPAAAPVERERAGLA